MPVGSTWMFMHRDTRQLGERASGPLAQSSRETGNGPGARVMPRALKT